MNVQNNFVLFCLLVFCFVLFPLFPETEPPCAKGKRLRRKALSRRTGPIQFNKGSKKDLKKKNVHCPEPPTYSQHRQKDLNNYFQTEVGKITPVGKQDVGKSLHFLILQRLSMPKLPEIIRGRLYVGKNYLIKCQNNKVWSEILVMRTVVGKCCCNTLIEI